MTGQHYDTEAICFAFDTTRYAIVQMLILAVVLWIKHKQHHEAKFKTRQRAMQVRDILLERIKKQNQLLKQLSTDLHNNTGQLLFAASIHLNVLEEQELPEASQLQVKKTGELLNQTSGEIRRLIKRIDKAATRPDELLPGIRHELDKRLATGKTTTRLRVQGSPYKIPKGKKIILLKIIEEIMIFTDEVHASEMSVIVRFNPDAFVLLIRISKTPTSRTENGLLENLIKGIANRCHIAGMGFQADTPYPSGIWLRIGIP